MQKYTLAVLVRNKYGVLNRVTSMFRRRQFNINALTVSETEDAELSRITVIFEGTEIKKEQLKNQLVKLPDVRTIKEFDNSNSISRELLLVKMDNNNKTRADIIAAANAFGANTVDYSHHSIMLQLCDTTEKIDDFVDIMREFTILEICRTGSVSLEKGSRTISNSVIL
jgi:acetolactate synthase I/III small subunit